MEQIDFTEQEKRILGRSGDLRVTARFRRAAAAVAILFILFFFAIGFATRSWIPVACIAAFYAMITAVEKIAYANTLDGCKRIIVKLCRRINELNKTKGS